VQVGDLVKYSSEWAEEHLYYEDEVMYYSGLGIILDIKKDTDYTTDFRIRGNLCFIKWTKGLYDTWERECDLELVNESR